MNSLKGISQDCLNLNDPNEVQIVLEDNYDVAIQIGMTILAYNDYRIGSQENGFENDTLEVIVKSYPNTEPEFMSKVKRILEILNEDQP